MSDLLPTYRGTVYPWHCDHMGHMNVMWYVGKFDEATWNVFSAMGMTAAYLREQQRGMVAVQQNLSYRRELHAGDTVAVRSTLLELRPKVVRFLHEMRNADTDEVAALCELTGVHIDTATRKSCLFPENILARARDLVHAYSPPA